MQANLMKMGFGLLGSLAAAVVFLVLLAGSPPVAAAEGKAFIFLPGEAPRYGGQQGREADITELLATAEQTGGVVGLFLVLFVAGLGVVGWRTTSSESQERRAAALDKAGVGKGWTKGDLGVGRTFAFESPDGHRMELVWDVEKYTAPPELRSRILTRRSRRPLQGLPPRRLDHVNLMASDVTTQKELFGKTTFGGR